MFLIVMTKISSNNNDITSTQEANDWTSLWNTETIKTAQYDDTYLKIIIDTLNGNDDLFFHLPKRLQSNILNKLYRITPNKLLIYGNDNLIEIPPKLRHKILQYFHEANINLHQGTNRMYLAMKRMVHWIGMRTDIRKFCNWCLNCKKIKHGKKRRSTKLTLFPCSKPFEMIAIDIVGPLTTCKSEQILSDRGSQFMSNIFRVLNDTFGIKKLFTTAYNPSCNGMIERFHRWLKERLNLIAADRDVNKMTQHSPFEIIFGKPMRLPAHVIIDKNNKESNKINHSVVSINPNEKSSESNKYIYDKQREKYFNKTISNKQQKFKTDDLVLGFVAERSVGNKRKLQPRYDGPFKITSILNHNNVVINWIGTTQSNAQEQSIVINVSKLIPYKPRKN
eukprot:52645_1